MRKFILAVAATAAFGLAAPASAAELQTAPLQKLAAAVQNGDVNVTYVQDYYRPRAIRNNARAARRYAAPGRYYRGGPRHVQRGYYGPRRYGYYGPRYYRRDYGSAAAAGAVGLAAGAIIGGAIAQSQAAPAYRGNAYSYCAQRFRSYDPASGTYMGYDGRRHPCP